MSGRVIRSRQLAACSQQEEKSLLPAASDAWLVASNVFRHGGVEMIDHVVLNVRDLAASRAFYEEALEPLGITVLAEYPNFIGLGEGKAAYLWLAERQSVTENVHVAFRCEERSLVDGFYEAALEAGGEDNGAPGLREIYHPTYYGAFVLDPDGNNIEAVCHH